MKTLRGGAVLILLLAGPACAGNPPQNDDVAAARDTAETPAGYRAMERDTAYHSGNREEDYLKDIGNASVTLDDSTTAWMEGQLSDTTDH